MGGAISEVFGFKGRLTRRSYWRWYLTLALIAAGIWVAVIVSAMSRVPILSYGLLFLLLIAIYASIGTAVRRLHDRGKSGWWLLLYQGAPLAAGSLSWWLDTYGVSSPATFWTNAGAALAGLVISIWGLIEIGFLKGQGADNRYGSVPS